MARRSIWAKLRRLLNGNAVNKTDASKAVNRLPKMSGYTSEDCMREVLMAICTVHRIIRTIFSL